MASEIRVNKINNRAGLGTMTFTDTGIIVSGITTTTDNIRIDADNKKLQIGSNQYLEIYDDGSYRYIQAQGHLFIDATGDINFRNGTTGEYKAAFNNNGPCALNFNGIARIATTNTGINVTGNVVGDGLTIDGNSDLNGRLDVDGVAGIGSLTVAGVSTFSGNVRLGDNNKLIFGNGSDLQVFHDTANNYFNISNGQIIFAKTSGETIAQFIPDGGVKLRYDNVQRFETVNGGVQITGVTTSSGGFSGNLTGNVTGTASLATDLAINGTNQIVYQDSNNDSDVLPTGNAGQILASNGAGAAPQWVNSAPAGAIEGITIREESSIVGTANSISTINFIGSVVTADAAAGAGIATVTIDALSGLLVKEDEANVGTAITAFDFSGSLVDVDAASNSGIATVQIDGLTIKDEGSTVGTAGSITTINFVGTGIAAAVSGGTATVTSSGGATTDDVVALAIALG